MTGAYLVRELSMPKAQRGVDAHSGSNILENDRKGNNDCFSLFRRSRNDMSAQIPRDCVYHPGDRIILCQGRIESRKMAFAACRTSWADYIYSVRDTGAVQRIPLIAPRVVLARTGHRFNPKSLDYIDKVKGYACRGVEKNVLSKLVKSNF